MNRLSLKPIRFDSDYQGEQVLAKLLNGGVVIDCEPVKKQLLRFGTLFDCPQRIL